MDDERGKNQQLAALLAAAESGSTRSADAGRLDDKRSSSSLLIDTQLVELEKHANNLHHLLLLEKAKVKIISKTKIINLSFIY